MAIRFSRSSNASPAEWITGGCRLLVQSPFFVLCCSSLRVCSGDHGYAAVPFRIPSFIMLVDPRPCSPIVTMIRQPEALDFDRVRAQLSIDLAADFPLRHYVNPASSVPDP